MLNALWGLLILVSVVVAGTSGHIADLGASLFGQAMQAVKLGLDLAGVVAFWFGVSRVAEKSGLLQVLARPVVPLLKLFFPGLRSDDPAFTSMSLNLVANALGLGNAATPFGLQAMRELHESGRQPGVATDEMILFLVLNSAALNLVPAGAIALRAATGSKEPAATTVASIIVTTCTFASAVVLWAIMRRLSAMWQR